MTKLEKMRQLNVNEAIKFLLKHFQFRCSSCPSYDELSDDCCTNGKCEEALREFLLAECNAMPSIEEGMIVTFIAESDKKEHAFIMVNDDYCFECSNCVTGFPSDPHNIHHIKDIKHLIEKIYVVEFNGKMVKIWDKGDEF